MQTLFTFARRTAAVGIVIGLFLLTPRLLAARDQLEKIPADPFFQKFMPVKAPAAKGLLLQTGDRLAICGDSITEQKMYSRIIETYLTACVPQLQITARQYGWSGETADGFLRRMKNDCLRFQPTIATLCYGMNDFRYKPYDEATARSYREKYTAVVRTFKEAGVKVVLGSPGCVGKMPSWVKSAQGTVEDLNLSLCAFRNIDIDIAQKEGTAFADVFWPQFTSGFEARHKYNPAYAIAGHDGVHPGWAGHLVMAYAYLKAMGLDGQIGTITVDLAAKKAEASEGHAVDSFTDGVLTITSRRYPFCAKGDPAKDDTIRSGMTLVPFDRDLNRLELVVKGGSAAKYKVTWGGQSLSYPAAALAAGVNLAADFPDNPFAQAFDKVDRAVAAKQAFETRQVKEVFHGKQGKADMQAAVAATEAQRKPLAAAVQAALVPVKHEIKIEAE